MTNTGIQRLHEGDKVYVQHRDGTRGDGRVVGFMPSGRAKVVARGLSEASRRPIQPAASLVAAAATERLRAPAQHGRETRALMKASI